MNLRRNHVCHNQFPPQDPQRERDVFQHQPRMWYAGEPVPQSLPHCLHDPLYNNSHEPAQSWSSTHHPYMLDWTGSSQALAGWTGVLNTTSKNMGKSVIPMLETVFVFVWNIFKKSVCSWGRQSWHWICQGWNWCHPGQYNLQQLPLRIWPRHWTSIFGTNFFPKRFYLHWLYWRLGTPWIVRLLVICAIGQ